MSVFSLFLRVYKFSRHIDPEFIFPQSVKQFLQKLYPLTCVILEKISNDVFY